METEMRWKSCCLSADKSFVMYITQLSMILLVICFCIAQLVTKSDCATQTTYVGLLTLLVGLVIPSPAIRKK